MRFCTAPVLAIAALLGPLSLTAQGTAAPATAPAIDFSGVLFGNFQYRTDSAAKAQTGGKAPSKFDIERAYLTFRMPAGERTSIRITTDIFQNVTDGYYAGWTVRLKYGYLQHELSKNLAGVEGFIAVARVGMLHTVVIDHIEQYWPRSLGNSAVERNGFFSSGDVGAATLLTLPNRRGEVYVTLTNGSNYTSGETDRFKDFAARISFTPFANGTGILKSLVIAPWYYKGASASAFILGGPTQVGPVSAGVQKDRRGVFVGLRERRLTGGAEFAQRVDGVETGNNTVAVPRVVAARTSDLTSVFALVRPAEWLNKDRQSRLGVVVRMDQFKLDNSLTASNRLAVVGVFWDLTPKVTLTMDLQSLDPQSGATTTPAKTFFVHWKADF